MLSLFLQLWRPAAREASRCEQWRRPARSKNGPRPSASSTPSPKSIRRPSSSGKRCKLLSSPRLNLAFPSFQHHRGNLLFVSISTTKKETKLNLGSCVQTGLRNGSIPCSHWSKSRCSDVPISLQLAQRGFEVIRYASNFFRRLAG